MTTCETLTHGTCVFLSQRHRFGTDAMLLADDCVIIEPTQKDLENQGFVAGSICF